MKLKIHNLKDNDKIMWKKIKCCCITGDQEHSYPFTKCLHCKYQQAENSLPKESFKVNQSVLDKNGKHTGKTIEKEIKEITIVRGSHDDVIGWKWN
jgi:hypothetical protein|tara:strand:+ start:377 stop:664 length:288 start_codon:yes stop_codon:yes gene_type:complete